MQFNGFVIDVITDVIITAACHSLSTFRPKQRRLLRNG
jgi:hypothetical protein